MTRVIICGAGSAGCVTAARLSEDPQIEVLLLEAGGAPRSIDELPDAVRDAWSIGTAPDWGYQATVAGASHRAGPALLVPALRGRGLGGSSAVNATNALRPPRQDFDAWVGLGNDRWSWDDVLPTFQTLEDDPIGGDRHGTGGPVPIRRAATNDMQPVFRAFVQALAGEGCPVVADLNAIDTIGVGPLPVNAVDRVRQSTNITHLIPARTRGNLEVRGDVVVDRVELTEGRATAVLLASGERLSADVVILAAGSFGSPGILMRSGVGPADVLDEVGVARAHVLEGVGRNLRDHPMVFPSWELRTPASPDTAPLQVIGLLSSAGFHAHLPPDLNIIPNTRAGITLTMSVGLMRPYSLGTVAIRSAEPQEPPNIDFNAFDHPEDLARMIVGLKLARALARTQPLAAALAHERWPGRSVSSDSALADAITTSASTYAHATSTCAMGPSHVRWSVVDQAGGVYGLDGLYVIDASILPSIPSVPTNMTVMMVAERCSALLAASLHG